jgi:hypothetical protein
MAPRPHRRRSGRGRLPRPRRIRRWFSELDEVWAELSLEVEEIRDLGEGRVFVLSPFHAVGLESGVPIDQPQGFVFTIEGGNLALAWGFASRAQAFEAAGLSKWFPAT